MAKNKALVEEKKNTKSNGEQSNLCDFEVVTLKLELQAKNCLTTELLKWYQSLLAPT